MKSTVYMDSERVKESSEQLVGNCEISYHTMHYVGGIDNINQFEIALIWTILINLKLH